MTPDIYATSMSYALFPLTAIPTTYLLNWRSETESEFSHIDWKKETIEWTCSSVSKERSASATLSIKVVTTIALIPLCLLNIAEAIIKVVLSFFLITPSVFITFFSSLSCESSPSWIMLRSASNCLKSFAVHFIAISANLTQENPIQACIEYSNWLGLDTGYDMRRANRLG